MIENQIAIVPQSFLNEVLEKLDLIESKINNDDLGIKINSEYISEKEAIKEFGKKTTWFWNQRQKGLKVYKMGNTSYYLKDDLMKLFK